MEAEQEAKRRRPTDHASDVSQEDVASRLQDFAPGIKALNIPVVPDAVKKELARYRCVRHGTIFQSWLGDGEMLIQTKFGNTNQLHLVSAPAGYRKQLTFEREPIGEAKRLPATSNFIYSMDEGGDEYYKYYYFDSSAGMPICMSSPSDRKLKIAAVAAVSKTGGHLAYSINKRGKEFDIWCVAMPPSGSDFALYENLLDKARPLAQTPDPRQMLHAEDWSPDGSQLLVRISQGASDSRLAVVDVHMGLESKGLSGLQLLPIEGNAPFGRSDPTVCEKAGDTAVRFASAKWLKDGSLLFVSDSDSEYLTLRLWSKREGVVHVTTPSMGTAPQAHDVVAIRCHAASEMVCYSLNEDGLISVYLLNLTDLSQVKRVPNVLMGKVTLGDFTDDGQRIAYTVDSIQCPGDVFAYDVRDGVTTRWTFSETGPLQTHLFVEPTRLHFPTFDAPRKIPCWVYRPATTSGGAASTPHPVVIYIHGGPVSQTMPTFRPANHPQCHQVLLDNGIAVLAPDVRGSSGYGKTYLKLDDWELREDSVKDIGALIDWVGTQSDLDRSRICIMGRSYGGYMTLKCMQLFSDRIKCAVDTCGMSSLLSFLESIPEWRRDLRRPEYGDERLPHIRQFLVRDAPLTNVHCMNVPALILQGEKDSRVPVKEAFQIFKALEDKGLSPWLFVATNEGHIFQKRDVIDTSSEVILTFITEQLLA